MTTSAVESAKYGKPLGSVEYWSPTLHIRQLKRWTHVDSTLSLAEVTLQQSWVEMFTGKTEWRDVPTVEEEK